MCPIETLLALQEADQEWDAKAQAYQALRSRLSDQSELATRREAQHTLTKELFQARDRLHALESELDHLQQRMLELEAALYGGEVGSPRELDSMRKDHESSRRRIDTLEDQALALMSDVEQLEASQQRGEQALRHFEAEAAREHVADVAEYNTLHARLKLLQGSREQLRSQLSKSVLALYDRLRSTKGSHVLAPMRDAACQICRVTVPSRKAQLVRERREVVTCEGCGRILYSD